MKNRTCHDIKITYCVGKLRFTGGTKVVFQHVRLLRDMGYDARIFTKKTQMDGLYGIEPVEVGGFLPATIGEPHIVVATVPEDMKELCGPFLSGETRLVWLVQGMYLAGIERNMCELAEVEPYRRSRIRRMIKRRHYKRKRRLMVSLYRSSITKVVVSEVVKREVDMFSDEGSVLIPNGIDTGVFHPSQKIVDLPAGQPLRLLSVGPADVREKGIQYVLQAVQILKQRGYTVSLTRASYTPQTALEKKSGIVDEYLENLSDEEMAELYRSCHMLVGSSIGGEGFSMPPVEGMGCGLPCVLTSIPAHLSYDGRHDYALFVPPGKPLALADAIERMAADKTLRKSIISAGFRVAENHSLTKTASRLDTLFKRLLGIQGASSSLQA